LSRSEAAVKAGQTRQKRMAIGFYKDEKGRTRPITPRKRMTKKDLEKALEEAYERLQTLRSQVYDPEWVREAWRNFDNLDDKTLVNLAIYELDKGNFEDAKDVLSEIQRRYPWTEVRDDLSHIWLYLSKIYETLRKLKDSLD